MPTGKTGLTITEEFSPKNLSLNRFIILRDDKTQKEILIELRDTTGAIIFDYLDNGSKQERTGRNMRVDFNRQYLESMLKYLVGKE